MNKRFYRQGVALESVHNQTPHNKGWGMETVENSVSLIHVKDIIELLKGHALNMRELPNVDPLIIDGLEKTSSGFVMLHKCLEQMIATEVEEGL